ncbi:MAG: hypothetical protein GY857_00705 [Desulfobacula sp.]|nr:hypothetical protein [Desulfobacula sp.]
MTYQQIKIAIADDHTTVRHGLSKLLEQENYIKIIGKTVNVIQTQLIILISPQLDC